MSNENKPGSGDLLGMRPLAGAIEHASNKLVDGIGSVLGRICLPAAEEFGLALKDRVSQWRQHNLSKMLEAAKPLVDKLPAEAHAHPKLVHEIVEQASWADSPDLQRMWAGLLASSCSDDGANQDNLLLINILKQLTPLQVRLLEYAVEHTKKQRANDDWLTYEEALMVNVADLKRVAQTNDFHKIDLALDHLRSLSLIDPEMGGFIVGDDKEHANLTATSMAMNLVARAHGWAGNVLEFYKI